MAEAGSNLRGPRCEISARCAGQKRARRIALEPQRARPRDGAMGRLRRSSIRRMPWCSITSPTAGSPRAMCGKPAAFAARAVSSEPGNAAYHFALANISFLFRHELTDAAHPDSEAVLRPGAFATLPRRSRLAPAAMPNTQEPMRRRFTAFPSPIGKPRSPLGTRFFDLVPQKDFALVNLARSTETRSETEPLEPALQKSKALTTRRLKRRIEARQPPEAARH